MPDNHVSGAIFRIASKAVCKDRLPLAAEQTAIFHSRILHQDINMVEKEKCWDGYIRHLQMLRKNYYYTMRLISGAFVSAMWNEEQICVGGRFPIVNISISGLNPSLITQ